MSKKKKARNNRKNILEFEIKNSQELESSELEKVDATVKEINPREEVLVQEAEIERKEIISEDVMHDEGDLSEAVTVQEDEVVEKPLTEKQKNRKMDMYIEFILIFILGLLIGIAIKTEAGKRITIGFDGYQMKIVQQDFDINKIQFEVTKKSLEEAGAQTEEPNNEGETSQIEE